MAKIVAGLLLLVPHLMTAGMVWARRSPPATLAALLTLPLAAGWFRGVWAGPVGESHVVGAARLHLIFGLLFAAGLWIGP